MKSRLPIALLLSLAVVHPAMAQTHPAATEPAAPIKGLPTVFLTDQRGVEHTGQLLRVAPEEVVMLQGDQERAFKRGEIALLEKRGDSLRNGALIGAAVGVFAGITLSGLADCPDGGSDCPTMRVVGVLISTGVYSAIGAGIDAAISGRTVMYRASKVTLQATPQKLQVAFALRW